MDNFFSILFLDPPTLFYIEGQLRTGTVVHHEDNFTFIHFEDLTDLCDVGVFKLFVGFYFAFDVF